MNKTFKISYSLKNTYRANAVLYSIKQIPLVKKLFPEEFYSVWGLKIFANVISAIWEIISVFLGKSLYLAVMVYGAGTLYKSDEPQAVFLHILLFLTAIGAFTNTYMFNPSKDKYYAMFLMRMDAREYTLVNYAYSILKVIVGFLPLSIVLGVMSGLEPWLCLLIPFFVAALKAAVAAARLYDFEKNGEAANENAFGNAGWIILALLLAAAYGLPAAGFVIPVYVSAAVMLLSVLAGVLSAGKILRFSDYRQMYRQILTKSEKQLDTTANAARIQSRNAISNERGISSGRKGFEYLNELFIKRHQKILWKASKQVAAVSLAVLAAVPAAFYIFPEFKEKTNELLLNFLPYFVFIMYLINRGTGFTRALFMNCDHSLLTYPFYKEPRSVLRLFSIRLREIIKVNLLPAFIIGIGLPLLLYLSGGTDNPLNYLILFVSIICMSIFFSVHYLTIYYLLQPYNAGTQIKSGTYQLVLTATYLVSFYIMKLRVPIFAFGIAAIAFCILYCVLACVLIYRLAPKTFKLRN